MAQFSVQVYADGTVAIKLDRRQLALVDAIRFTGTLWEAADTLRWEAMGHGYTLSDNQALMLARKVKGLPPEEDGNRRVYMTRQEQGDVAAKMLYLRDHLGYSWDQLGKDFGLSHERCRQLVREAAKRRRRKAERKAAKGLK